MSTPTEKQILEASIEYAYDGRGPRRAYEYDVTAQGFRAGVEWYQKQLSAAANAGLNESLKRYSDAGLR